MLADFFLRLWRKDSQWRRPAVLLTIAVLAFTAMFFWYIIPWRERLLTLEAQTGQQEGKNEQLEQYALQSQNSTEGLRQKKQQYALLQRKLPMGLEVGSFLLEVEQAARESGVFVLQIRPREVQQEAAWRQIPVEMAVRGSFQNVQLFLTSLGELERLTVLQSMLLKERQEEVQAKLVVVIYSNRDD